MPWKVSSLMTTKKEFVALAKPKESNISELCRRFGVSRKTAYKWIGRFRDLGVAGLEEKSRRPGTSPGETPVPVQEEIFRVREEHPTWGGRKIRIVLGQTMEPETVPAASTINSILKRHGYIDPQESAKHRKWRRFEAAEPNDLWQMDFKGHFAIADGRCHPLTVLDDHSRYSIGIKACSNERGSIVKSALADYFKTYGLPRRILCDNGAPWGDTADSPYTRLTVWIMRTGVVVTHSGPRHPQTVGKDERFHRTLKAEVAQYCSNLDLQECQERFDRWRIGYNTERPHESLNMATPASRYRVSPRSFPETLPGIEYGPGDHVRKVQAGGLIHYRGREYRICKAFHGEWVAIRPTPLDGVFDVYFCNQHLRQIDLREADEPI